MQGFLKMWGRATGLKGLLKVTNCPVQWKSDNIWKQCKL